MDGNSSKAALDPIIAAMERRWHESGIPGIYVGGNGPVSRERARNILDSPAYAACIMEKIRLARSEAFRKSLEGMTNL